MKIVIIEDELKTAEELKYMLEDYDSNISVVKLLHSVVSSIEWFTENSEPDLILSDIQLGDGLSFEIFKEIEANAPVIYCTAFDQYAIRAFESNSIDYLLKPIEEDKLHKSIEKYRYFKEHLFSKQEQKTVDLANLIKQVSPGYKQNILVNYREKIIPIKVSDVKLAHVSHGSVYLHLRDGAAHVVQYTIEELETILDPRQFFRVNRQSILNRDFILNIEHYFHRKLVVSVVGGFQEKIIISKVKAPAFLNWVEL